MNKRIPNRYSAICTDTKTMQTKAFPFKKVVMNKQILFILLSSLITFSSCDDGPSRAHSVKLSSLKNIGQRPKGVTVPKKLIPFLNKIENAYAKKDINKIMDLCSTNFLYQGMDKIQFRKHLKYSTIFNSINSASIIITEITLEKHSATIIGFAETDFGILSQASQLLPISEGCKIIKEEGKWKLHGNQHAKQDGQYKKYESLTVFIKPRSIEQYRNLLPTIFEIPDNPIIRIRYMDCISVASPLLPYKIASVSLLAKYNNIEGWYALVIFENAWLPVMMGRSIGYPKFIADSIELIKSMDKWIIQVTNNGKKILKIEYVMNNDEGTWFEQTTRRMPFILFRKILDKEKSSFLIAPPFNDELHAVYLQTPLAIGIPSITENFGSAKIDFYSDEKYSSLIDKNITSKAIFTKFNGGIVFEYKKAASIH